MTLVKKTLRIIRYTLLTLLISSILAVIAYRFIPVPMTPLMIIRCGQNIAKGKMPKISHKWVSLDEMSRSMPVAVMASEDGRFLKHNGFDFKEIDNALKERKRKGHSRGASTISQQTAKNVFLWPTSSWVRKGFEVYFTVLIETLWSKQRIMEVYLNSIEMGDGIYGVEAVAREHFGTTASELTRSQCALIAATLPNPIKMNSAAPSAYVYKRQSWILRQMRFYPAFPTKKPSEE
ncbi:MAG: monofunctional biosynthetic peptidoglycan transglycosylase [Bacteroidaceae bacterium]|nr:monofunctional biosynthetic peptidoglycan transglycosylase [Bacteroidaceae bacterium]